MKESKIFTSGELRALDERLKGSKKDLHGTFAGRVKPKIIELLEWFKIRKKLKKLLKPKKP